jgi:hypothetical protein
MTLRDRRLLAGTALGQTFELLEEGARDHDTLAGGSGARLKAAVAGKARSWLCINAGGEVAHAS